MAASLEPFPLLRQAGNSAATAVFGPGSRPPAVGVPSRPSSRPSFRPGKRGPRASWPLSLAKAAPQAVAFTANEALALCAPGTEAGAFEGLGMRGGGSFWRERVESRPCGGKRLGAGEGAGAVTQAMCC